MSKKYDVWFCRCGTIQLMPEEYYGWLQEDYANRSIIRVCQNCGRVQRVWLSEWEDGFAVNASDIEDVELTPASNCRILMYKGIRVPMKSGEYATSHFNTYWFDDNGSRDVDAEHLIRVIRKSYPDTYDDVLRSIAGYVSGINWNGTPYQLY